MAKGRFNGVAENKFRGADETTRLSSMGISVEEQKGLARFNERNGDISFRNPENGRVVATLRQDGSGQLDEGQYTAYKRSIEARTERPFVVNYPTSPISVRPSYPITERQLSYRSRLSNSQLLKLDEMERKLGKNQNVHSEFKDEIVDIAKSLGIKTNGLSAWTLSIAINETIGSRL